MLTLDQKAAFRQLSLFIHKKLKTYAWQRNDPTKDALSNMSAYLHFGQISSLRIASGGNYICF